MNTLVNHELCRQLRKAGYNEPQPRVAPRRNGVCAVSDNAERKFYTGILLPTVINSQLPDKFFTVPTVSDVVMWLYRTKGIWLYVYQPNQSGYWAFNLEGKAKYNTMSEAYNEGIKYILNNE